MKKPSLKHLKGLPDDASHSAMHYWARSIRQPYLLLTTIYHDDSVSVETIDPATREVKYWAGGEFYYQTVDVKKRWNLNGDSLGIRQVVEAEKAFCKKHGIGIKSIKVEISENLSC